MIQHKLLKCIALFYIGLIGSTVQTFGQDDTVVEIRFNFLHALRIPDHHVTIEFQKFQDSVSVHVASTPLHKSPKWDSTNREYYFYITKDEFDKIVTSVKLINCTDILTNLSFTGKDGKTCEIEFGNYNTAIRYSVWTPDYNTKERHLQSFLQSCRLILQIAKLNPDNIF